MEYSNELLGQLREKAKRLRRGVIECIGVGNAGHVGGGCSCADIVAALYFYKMRYDPKDPAKKDRDRFLLSKGHAAIVQYAALAEAGFFPREELPKTKSLGAMLQGHPDRLKTPGVEAGTGSLGQGLSIGLGMALAQRLDGLDSNTYVILGDGEIAEGQVWEAAMAANKFHLDNLCAVIDLNGLQIDGTTEEVMPTEPVDKKFESFGWHVIKIDGHDFEQIDQAFEEAKATKGQPTVILAKTVKGKGVSFMENQAGWHGKAPNDEQFAQARAELEAAIKELEG